MKKISLAITVGFALIVLGCASNGYLITPTKVTTASARIMETPANMSTSIPTLMNTQPSPTALRDQPNPFPTQGKLSDQDFILQLLQTNGGCKLPCWWGIVPGETHWDETEQFLLDLSLNIELIKDETTTEVDDTSSRRRAFDIYIDIDIGDAKTHRLGLWTRDNLVTGIRISSPLTNYHFVLNDLLSDQGVPDKIFVFTHANVMEPPTAFNLILYYQEQRFLAAYSTLVYKENEQITACFDDIGPGIIIFPDEKDLSDQQIQEVFLGPDPIGVLSIDDAIGMSPTVFYETYRNSEISCLVTPANIWP